jgi:hypothetical protein
MRIVVDVCTCFKDSMKFCSNSSCVKARCIPTVLRCRSRKLFRFPCTDSGDFGVNLSLLDKVVKYKTIERFAETMAGEVTIVSYDLRLENVWCGDWQLELESK